MTDATLPLKGLKVLDLSRLLPGPFCTLLLADLGADVLKIEDPGAGDYARHYPPIVGESGTFFQALNRNKRSMTLNLKAPDAVEIFLRLADEADVVVESFRPGVMARLGLGPELLRERNPRLVYAAISGYGQDGPMAARAGHDLNYIARAGMLDQNGRAGQAPVVPGFQLADIAGGALFAAVGILSALLGRERTGEGRLVDVSMTEGALAFGMPLFAGLDHGVQAERGRGMLTGGLPCYGVYETADGRHLAVGPLEPKFWAGFCEAIEAPELAADGLSTGEQGEAARAVVAAKLRAKSLEAWVAIFEATDVCVEPVRTPQEVVDDELFRARKVFFDLAGVRQTRTPITPVDREHTPAPGQGADTDVTLRALGFDVGTIEELRERGVV